jgi:hypothetical protein
MEWDTVQAYPLNRYLRRMGLWRLDDGEPDSFARRETPTAGVMRDMIAHRLNTPRHPSDADQTRVESA